MLFIQSRDLLNGIQIRTHLKHAPCTFADSEKMDCPGQGVAWENRFYFVFEAIYKSLTKRILFGILQSRFQCIHRIDRGSVVVSSNKKRGNFVKRKF